MELTQEFHDERQLGALADPQTHLTRELQFQCWMGLWCRDFDEAWGKGFLKPEQFVEIVYTSATKRK